LVIAQSKAQALWLQAPAILSILFGIIRKEYPTVFNIQVVYGSAYDFIITSNKAEILSINSIKDTINESTL
jgi:hypothetical protein